MNKYSFIFVPSNHPDMREKDSGKVDIIFKAALKLVLSEGFTALKMSALAKEAGIAAGTIYLYFDSKEELINQLYVDLKRRNSLEFLKGYDPELPFMDGFETIWYNYLDTALGRPEEVAFLEQYYRSPYLRDDVRQESEKLLQPIFDLLERGKNEALVQDIPTPILVAHLSGSMNELVRWHVTGALRLDENTRSKAFELAWNSIKKSA